MSYANYDHAGWVQAQGDAHRRRHPNTRSLLDRYDVPIGWEGMPKRLNDAQARAINILGMVCGGIYNAPVCWDTVCWFDDGIKVTMRGGLSTYDFSALTRLVLLCHAARMRANISPASHKELFLSLTQRKDAPSESLNHHPDIAEALAEFEKFLPPEHHVRFAPAPEKAA